MRVDVDWSAGRSPGPTCSARGTPATAAGSGRTRGCAGRRGRPARCARSATRNARLVEILHDRRDHERDRDRDEHRRRSPSSSGGMPRSMPTFDQVGPGHRGGVLQQQQHEHATSRLRRCGRSRLPSSRRLRRCSRTRVELGRSSCVLGGDAAPLSRCIGRLAEALGGSLTPAPLGVLGQHRAVGGHRRPSAREWVPTAVIAAVARAGRPGRPAPRSTAGARRAARWCRRAPGAAPPRPATRCARRAPTAGRRAPARAAGRAPPGPAPAAAAGRRTATGPARRCGCRGPTAGRGRTSAWAISSASATSASVASGGRASGSRARWSENSVGSSNATDDRLRSDAACRSRMSWPSRVMRPAVTSYSRGTSDVERGLAAAGHARRSPASRRAGSRGRRRAAPAPSAPA